MTIKFGSMWLLGLSGQLQQEAVHSCIGYYCYYFYESLYPQSRISSKLAR